MVAEYEARRTMLVRMLCLGILASGLTAEATAAQSLSAPALQMDAATETAAAPFETLELSARLARLGGGAPPCGSSRSGTRSWSVSPSSPSPQRRVFRPICDISPLPPAVQATEAKPPPSPVLWPAGWSMHWLAGRIAATSPGRRRVRRPWPSPFPSSSSHDGECQNVPAVLRRR